MQEFKKKVCVIGSFAVGKTSLIRRFVSGIFSEEYLTTVGVKIDQKVVSLNDGDVLMMVWDLAGSDEFAKVQKSHLAGSSGFLFVADGTRPSTLEDVLQEADALESEFPGVTLALLINKADLKDEWEVSPDRVEELNARFPVWITSAMTGESVERAFENLAERMIQS